MWGRRREEGIIMRYRSLAVVGIVVGISGSLFAQGPPRRDGRWEVTMQMDMPGMKMPPTTTIQCVTPADVDDPQKAFPTGQPGNTQSKCSMSDYKLEGNTVTWKMQCEGRMPTSGSGKMVYSASTYDGSMVMTMQGGQVMTMKYSGKRLGDCVK
jgi:hypothetical protein